MRVEFEKRRKNIEQFAELAVLESAVRVRGTESDPIVVMVYDIVAKQFADLFLP